MTNEVVKTEEAQLPDFMRDDMEEFAGAGGSDRAGDAALPFMVVLQSLSPQVSKKNGSYIEGAEPGMIMNNATMEIHDGENDGLIFVPSFYSKKFVEWIPRSAGGGYVGTYDRDDPYVSQAKPKMVDGKARGLITASGNDLVETDYYFGVIEDTMMPAIIALASTGLKTSRGWQSLYKSQRRNGQIMPFFANRYRIKTAWQSNDSGEWYAPVVTLVGQVADANLYTMAKEFYIQCKAGEVNIGRPDDHMGGEEGDGAIDVDGEVI